MIPTLILGAGASRRMRGTDKLLEEVDGQPLIARQARIALPLGAPVLVTVPALDHPRAAALAGIDGLTLIPVLDAADGLSASLKRGIAALPGAATAVLILLGDLPEIETSDLNALIATHRMAPDNDIWRGTTPDGTQGGHPLLLSARLFPQVAALTGDQGARPLLKAAQDERRLCPVPLPDARAITDLDTPEAWAAWRARKSAM